MEASRRTMSSKSPKKQFDQFEKKNEQWHTTVEKSVNRMSKAAKRQGARRGR